MAQSTRTNSPPVHTVKLGRMEAAVWKHDGDNGARHSVTVSKSYRLPEQDRGKQDNGWRRTTSFGRDDCFILAEALRQAALWIARHEQTQSGNEEAKR